MIGLRRALSPPPNHVSSHVTSVSPPSQTLGWYMIVKSHRSTTPTCGDAEGLTPSSNTLNGRQKKHYLLPAIDLELFYPRAPFGPPRPRPPPQRATPPPRGNGGGREAVHHRKLSQKHFMHSKESTVLKSLIFRTLVPKYFRQDSATQRSVYCNRVIDGISQSNMIPRIILGYPVYPYILFWVVVYVCFSCRGNCLESPGLP